MEKHINVILRPGAPGKNLNLSTTVIPGLTALSEAEGTRNPGPWTPAFTGAIPIHRDSE